MRRYLAILLLLAGPVWAQSSDDSGFTLEPELDLEAFDDDGLGEVEEIEQPQAAAAAGVTEDLTDRISAVDLVRAAAEALGGKGGGGRPDMAQAGGADPSKAPEAIAAVESLIAG